MMEKSTIRTYSRKQPISIFKPATSLVPSYPDSTDTADVRESRLLDKTLVVNVFEDSFDRLTTGVIVQSSKYTEALNSSNEDIDNIEKITSHNELEERVSNENKNNENKEKIKEMKNYEKTESKENKKEIANVKSGTKRKFYDYNGSNENVDTTPKLSENEDFAETVIFEDPENKRRKVVNIKENTLPIGKSNKCMIPLETFNSNENLSKRGLINIENNDTKKSSNLIKESSKFLNPNILKYKEEILLTSTPREKKLPANVNVQNLSPITLDNGKNENDQQYLKPLLTQNENQLLDEDSFQSNINNKSTVLIQDTFEFLKLQNKKLKNNVQNDNKSDIQTSAINTKEVFNEIENKLLNENDVDNNLSVFESLPNNGLLNTVNNENIHEKQSAIIPATMEDKEYLNIQSFNESPLLFDDTQHNEIQICTDKLEILDNVCNNLNISLELDKSPIKNKEQFINALEFVDKSLETCENFNSSHSDSFSLHEWSNEYNSSYEYLTEAERMKHNKSPDFENNKDFQKNLNDQSTTFNNLNSENQMSILPNNDFIQSENNTSKIMNTENIVPINDIIISKNKKNEIDIKDILPDKDKIIDNFIKHNLDETFKDEDLNINVNEQISPQILKIMKSEKQIKENLNVKSNKSNIYVENILDNKQNNVNNNGQTIERNISPLLKNLTSENGREKNKETDNILNGRQLIICIPRLSNLNIKNISSIALTNSNKYSFRQSKETQIINNEETLNKETRKSIINNFNKALDKNHQNDEIIEDNIYNVKNTDKISEPNESNDLKLKSEKSVVGISKFENVNNISPILTKRVLKRNTKLSAIQKIKNCAMKKPRKHKNIVVNVANNTLKTKKEKTDYTKIEKNNVTTVKSEVKILSSDEKSVEQKQFDKILKNKEVRVLVSRLEDLYTEYKPFILPKNSTNQKSTKTALKKTKNIQPIIEEKSLIKNDKIIGINVDIIEHSIADKFINKNRTISSKKNVRVSFEYDNEASCLNDQNLLDPSELNNPVKIIRIRDTFKKLSRPLACINENQSEEFIDNMNKDNDTLLISDVENTSLEENKMNNSSDDANKNQAVFLKPGKSWARSLSIINHFNEKQNLDELAIGRGKNWRHSVQTVLNMQPEDVIQGKNKRHSVIMKSPRFSRRFSTRIVPSGKISTHIEDFIDTQRISNMSDGTRLSYMPSGTRRGSTYKKLSLRSQKENLIESEDDLIKSARNIILKRCKQTSYVPFDVCFPDSFLNHCCKIGEGVYGEVFLYKKNNEKSVIKIIPIEGEELVNCESQKKFHEILSEIIIAQELHKLRFGEEYNTNGFVGLNKISCVIGSYPDKLIKLWNKYDQEKKSDNDCPSMFSDKQLYIVLELTHGGQDLEAFVFQDASQCHSIFIQTAVTLAIAEKCLEFEHRDLHWGNLLISKTVDLNSTFKLDNVEITIPTKGVKATVIDFTLSRMSYEGYKIFNDLATDPALFSAQGEYQFDIYRLMRDSVNNDWQQFKPFTNTLWLDYILDKMINEVKYKSKSTKIHKSSMEKMKKLKKVLLNYRSAFDFVKNCKNVLDTIKHNDNFT